jgi:ketosteroid isomerase-like protein
MTTMKHCCIICIILAVELSACVKPATKDLIKLDKEFSELSRERGMKYAFLEYAADSAVLLQRNVWPVVGKKAISAAFEAFSDSGFMLTWEPLDADMSKSGDFGYTYGLYTSYIKADSSVTRGKYVTIWKKQSDGSWKYVLDGGNEGL